MTDTAERARTRKRGAYAKTGAKRVAILDAALEVFAQGGYRSGSLREVAERVGMSEAGLLHHFPSKSALLEAALQRRDDLAEPLIPVETTDGADALRGLVELARYNASVPGVVELYCVLSAESTTPDHPAHAYFVRRYDWIRATLTEAFAKLARDGRLRPGVDPRRAAIGTVAFMDGLQVQWLLDRSVVDMADMLDDFLAGMIVDFHGDAAERRLRKEASAPA